MSATMIKTADIKAKAEADALAAVNKKKAMTTTYQGKTYTDEDAEMWVGVGKAIQQAHDTKDSVVSKNWHKKPRIATKDQAEGTDSLGGHGVFDELERALYRKPEMALTISDKVATRQGQSNLYERVRVVSGPTGAWVGEAEKINASDMTFDTQSIRPYKFVAMNFQSTEVLEDWSLAGDLGQEVMTEFRDEFAEERERVIFEGSGSTGKQPIGILNATNVARIRTARTAALQTEAAGIAVGSVTYEKVKALYYGLHQKFRSRGVFFCNEVLLPALMDLNDSVTGNKPFVPAYNPQQPREAAPGQEGWLFGKPLYTSDKLNTNYNFANTSFTTGGKATALIFCDPRQYLIYERRGLQLDVSKEYKFDTDQMTIRGTQRYGGDVWEALGFAILATKGRA